MREGFLVPSVAKTLQTCNSAILLKKGKAASVKFVQFFDPEIIVGFYEFSILKFSILIFKGNCP